MTGTRRGGPSRDMAATFAVNSDVVGGQYRVTVSFTDDHVRVLTPAEVHRYADTLLTVVARAQHDAAVLTMLRKLGVSVEGAASIVADLRRDRPPVDDAATAPARFTPIVATKTGRPFVHVFLDVVMLGQLTVTAARTHALHVLEAPFAVDLDAALHRTLIGKVGVPDATARAAIDDLARHRRS